MTRPVDAVIEFLEAEEARGVTHILLDEGAREGMRQLQSLTKGGKTPVTPAVPQIVSEAPAPDPPPAPARITLEGQSKAEQLASLRKQAESWPPARSLGTLRDIMVFATGDPDARIMLVGEAPGYEEEKKGEPFVGPAGQKLDLILTAMGLAREDVYISNIVKFRPATARQATNNRKPSPEEMAACLPFVREEIRIVKPDCIVALGGTAAEGLLGLDGAVGSMRGKWHEIDGVPVRVTYHPSYLLRSGEDNSIKRQLWEDMLAVMEKLEMPVNERQRGFFLPKT